MPRNSAYEPDVYDEDIERLGDEALGIYDRRPDEARTRLEAVGVKLTARNVLGDRRKAIFIRTLAQTGVVSRAAAAAGWAASVPHRMRKADEEFAELWNQALEFATDTLEMEARRRAVEGVEKPVYQQGRLVGHVTEYSDHLLDRLLKAKRPQQFRENFSIDADVKGGVLVVPSAPSEQSWEQSASSDQAKHRGNTGE